MSKIKAGLKKIGGKIKAGVKEKIRRVTKPTLEERIKDLEYQATMSRMPRRPNPMDRSRRRGNI